MAALTTRALVESLGSHPHRHALQALVRGSALDAALNKRAEFASRRRPSAPQTASSPVSVALTRADAETPYGNLLDVLERGVERLEEGALLGALLSLAIQSDPPAEASEAVDLAFDLVWLATKTPCDALRSLDEALGPDAGPIWYGVALVVSSPESVPADFGPTEALVAAAALRQSTSPEAQTLRVEACERVLDPVLRALLAPETRELGALTGELRPSPRSGALTALLALTLLLFLINAVRFASRFFFAYRKPASVQLGSQGIELSYRVQLMGQVLRERSTLVPFSNVALVTREIKYARVGLYAGLLALLLGTYLGAGLFVDGVRVPGGSAPLLALAASFIAIGLGADFVLSTGADSARGRCRLVVATLQGRSFCLGGLDPRLVDGWLLALAERTRQSETIEHPAEPVEPPRSDPGSAAPPESSG